jgi:hypothetical protein
MYWDKDEGPVRLAEKACFAVEFNLLLLVDSLDGTSKGPVAAGSS